MRKIPSLLTFLLVFSVSAVLLLSSSITCTEEDQTPLSGYSSAEIVSMMGLGYNIGNTFDATGGTLTSHESAWGNVPVTQEFVDAIYEAGFDTVRLPITWMDFVSKDGQYTIDPAYLARVKEVVDYCYNDGLFVIINLHHESWINRSDFNKAYMEIAPELDSLWTQIATYFADYDQHLIFEGMNEPRMAGTTQEWSGNRPAYAAVNYLNQVFVNAVLSTGLGQNHERCLMIPGYAAASSANIMKAIAMPTYQGESLSRNLIVSVHSYTPYEFCLQDTKNSFSLDNKSDTGSIDYVMRDINSIFLDNGIPVIIGETGATNSGNNTEDRVNWAYYMSKCAASHGIPVILWDNGSNGVSGGECHSYINRRTNQVVYPEIFEALQKGQAAVERGSARKDTGSTAEGSLLDGRTIWADANGLKATKEWDATYIQFSSETSFYPVGGKIAVVFKGSGSPQLVLDSEVHTQWWMPITPGSTENMGEYRIAYFTTDRILAELSKYNITNPEDLRYFSIVSTGSNITTYEIDVFGNAPATKLTFKANGQTVDSNGITAPAAPSVDQMSFLGWYTTPNYLPGTEFTGTAPAGVLTIYGKLGLKNYTPLETAVTPAATPVIVPLSERRPSPTPTPVIKNTPTVIPTPTSAATLSPTPETDETDNYERISEPDTSKAWWIVMGIGLAATILIVSGIAFIIGKLFKKK